MMVRLGKLDELYYKAGIEGATESLRSMAIATESAAGSFDMMNGVLNAVHCDTGLPGYLCDTGYPVDLPSAYYGRPIVRSTKVDNPRCSYCNVRALPNDRFCEGCGAPV